MKILVVDDHLLFIDALMLFLQKLPFNVEIISATSIAEAEKAIENYGPEIDLALVDLNLPKKGGVLFVRALTSKNFLIPTIIVSAEEDENRIRKGLAAGAQGFIPKSLSGDAMIAAILQVLDGKPYFPKRLIVPVVTNQDSNSLSKSILEENRIKLGISNRQYATLLLMAEGLSNKEVADHLFLSEHTVKSHTSVLFQLLDTTNRTECVLRAQKLQLVE
ncbi:MAG: DNA-binding response regulator [Gammaproteobacteria bacterium]|nr:MAG: DNA-binding response regulator [Gammaproteobacteria bacterium]